MATQLSDVPAGIGCLFKGASILFRRPKLLLLGALPAVVTTVLLLLGLVLMLIWADDFVDWATPFADGWSEGWQSLLRIALAVALVAGFGMLAVLAFATLTLAIGSPFYEKIAERVDQALGEIPKAPELSPWQEIRRGLKESGVFMLMSISRAIPLFLAGLIPVVGQTVVPVLAALTGGWLLAVELASVPFNQRGIDFKARRRALRKRPLLTIGFGVPAYLLCLVPLLAIIALPVCVAGATVLSRRVLRESDGIIPSAGKL
ncbi:EI24 domain-containing protein [Flindersiella endophytica]